MCEETLQPRNRDRPGNEPAPPRSKPSSCRHSVVLAIFCNRDPAAWFREAFRLGPKLSRCVQNIFICRAGSPTAAPGVALAKPEQIIDSVFRKSCQDPK